ncbi:hypothetical protein FNO01nite_18800 [Flavobacterium noncentrifugens]|uniref:Uncharacterized protein n=1 Tax=Flavobacterium noncentrifugens TaxID=1128970 RepID=A0A1G8YGZ3_9FLAO|nr:hypothetical protein [Flavobacterium noncentrifugens]GEP51208.1 hypothetical protein FNO01nite_18800 [Flavobacterium noncentrifugens]SDK01674.1 hypothetical protein SAMN04487935_2315 [Flavobacterium noncentrifugens]
MTLRFYTLLLVVVLCSSCATLFNNKHYVLDVDALQDNSTVKVYDSVYRLPAKILVTRSKANLPVVLESDGKQKTFELKAEPSRKFVLGNLPFIYLWPVSYGIDYTNHNRFYYGQHIKLDINDTTAVLKYGFLRNSTDAFNRYFNDPYRGKKGQINFAFGFPVASGVYNQSSYQNKSTFSLSGIKAGFDYFYSDRKFLNLSGQVLMSDTGFLPVDHFESYTDTYSYYISLTDNFTHKRFTFGYGLHYSLNELKVVEEFPVPEGLETAIPSVTTYYKNYALGVNVNGYFRFYKDFHVGIVYRPDIYLVKPEAKFNYGHAISGEIIWKIRLKK